MSWSDFRWENGLVDPTPVPHLPSAIVFDRAQYETVFAGIHARVAALPYDELPHGGRQSSGLGSGAALPRG